jgi:hypothetical protein
MLQGYNASRLKSSFRKFYRRYNHLVCDYKLSLAYMLNYLFHTLWYIVVSMLALKRVIPKTQCRVRRTVGVTGQQRTLTPPRHLILPLHLLEIRVALHSILYLPFGL